MKKALIAFTLAEVLIVLGIIGVVAEMTIPTLVSSTQEKVEVTGLLKFSSTLQQAVMMWKSDIECSYDSYACLEQQGLADNVCTNFDQLAKFLRVDTKTAAMIDGTENWLPVQTLDYYGNPQTGTYGGVSKFCTTMCGYRLNDGVNLAVDNDGVGYRIFVDVNGIKAPNRMGKDTFTFTVGVTPGNDLNYYPVSNHVNTNTLGICGYSAGACDPANVNPTIGLGASPTAYTILNGKLPDFKALSQSVAGFKP